MVPRKGVDNVIRAIGKVKISGTSCRLVVVGGESEHPDPATCPEVARLQKIAKEEEVDDLVTFVGRKDRAMLKYYYSASDIFVTTPWYEPFGITPLEAMACGTPVIGSDVGGIRYSIANGKSGLLVPPNDPGELAAKINLLLGDRELLYTMKNNAIQRVNALFTWAKVANAATCLYENMLQLVATPVAAPANAKKIKAA